MNESNEQARTTSSVGNDQGRSGEARKLLLILSAVLLLTLVALAIGLPWIQYRTRHLVIRNAVLKGTVTKMGARIDGRVQAIAAEVGQRVAKGDVVAKLEDEHLQVALKCAEAELDRTSKEFSAERIAIEQERRRLKLEVPRAEALRDLATGEIKAAESVLARLNKEYLSLSSLFSSRITSTNEMDRVIGERDHALALVHAKQGAVKVAEIGCQAAQLELDGLRVRESRLEILEAEVRIAREKVAAANAEMVAAELRAPEDGWVVEWIRGPGASAKVGEPIISLWVGQVWVEAWIDENDIRSMSVGRRVDVSVDAFPKETLPGRVVAVGILTDRELQDGAVPSTLHSLLRKEAMVPLRIALDRPNYRLQPGLSAVVGIERTDANPASPIAATTPSHRLFGSIQR